jgi:hypothetical protein
VERADGTREVDAPRSVSLWVWRASGLPVSFQSCYDGME